MAERITPKTEAIRAYIGLLVGTRSRFSSRNELAEEILKKWNSSHYNDADGWTHGLGKKAGVKPPAPKFEDCYAGFSKFINGQSRQNLRGWEMVAEILGVHVSKIVEISSGQGEGATNAKSKFGALLTPGELPLMKLANLDVFAPEPLEGANRVHPEPESRQSIALSARAIFNSIRDEEFTTPEGVLVAQADIELSYAYLVVHVSDPKIEVLNCFAMTGRQNLGDIQISYMGTEENCVVFEITPRQNGASLSGIAQFIEKLVEFRGCFKRSDYLGAGFDSNGIRLQNLRLAPTSGANETEKRPITRSMKEQIIRRGMALSQRALSKDKKLLAVKRFFMESVVSDPEH